MSARAYGRRLLFLSEAADLLPREERARVAPLLDPARRPDVAGLRFRRRDLEGCASDGGAETGVAGRLLGYYCGLETGRLVVLGEPGSGKRGAALDLAATLLGSLDRQRRPRRIPLMLDLRGFDPLRKSLWRKENSDTLTGPLGLSHRFDDWLAVQVAARLPRRRDRRPVARLLVSLRRVLPVLDGIDDMDEPGGPPLRAIATLHALTPDARRRPFVLACRTRTFDQANRHSLGTYGYPVLQQVTAITLAPPAHAPERSQPAGRMP
ncbi:hypothetical protein [Amycolatopsis rubida]|nr:hypothetical protein [Amycolatopsis rubida]